MNIKNKVKLCSDTLDAALPPDFIQSVTGRLPEGVEEIYPDVVFVNDMEVYAAFKMRPSEPKGIKQCLKELYWVLSKKEYGFSKIGIWEKEVHDIHMGKLCYSSLSGDAGWFHMLVTFEAFGRQYLFAGYCNIEERHIWEAVFNDIVDTMEVKSGRNG